MKKRRFGRCDFEVSEVSLGTWGLSGDAYGPVTEGTVDGTIDAAVEAGINLFETADVYGNGEMERKLGERLDPKTTFVVTKIGTVLEPEPAKKFDLTTLKVRLELCHERLKRDALDIVLLHCPSIDVLHLGEATEFLREEVMAGRLKGWGVSAGNLAVARTAIDLGADVLEIPYNALHPAILHELADMVATTDAAILARSVLSHGLLAGLWTRSRSFAEHDHRRDRWTRDGLNYRLDQLSALRPLVKDDVRTLRSLALRFVLANGLVSSAVLGPRSQAQLAQLIREAGEPPYLPLDTLTALPERLEAVGVQV